MYIVQAQLLMSAPPPDIFLTHPSGSSNTPKQSSSSVFFIITLYKAPLYQTASANVVISFDNWLKKLKKISGPQAIFLRIHISSWNGGYNTDTVSDGKIQIIILILRRGALSRLKPVFFLKRRHASVDGCAVGTVSSWISADCCHSTATQHPGHTQDTQLHHRRFVFLLFFAVHSFITYKKYQKLVHNRCARCNLFNLHNT